MITLLFYLLVGHAICDYPLQGDFLARAKNHRQPIPGIPAMQALFWHSLMHGGSVALLTHSVLFGVIETIIHMIVDWLKCEGVTTFNQDQAIHVACKVLWVILVTVV